MLKTKYRISLKHLLIDGEKQIGLQFYPNKVMNALVKSLPKIKWSKEFNMAYVTNSKSNVSKIFNIFKGVAWVDGKYFFDKKPVNTSNEKIDASLLKKLYDLVPSEYLDKLIIKKYATNTVRVYCSLFAKFMAFYPKDEVINLTELEVRKYLRYCN